MKVLIVEPGQYPREADIEPTLEAKQKIVGGLIDVAYPFPDDNVCVVLNDEGKLMGLPLNRALGDYDVIAGTLTIGQMLPISLHGYRGIKKKYMVWRGRG